MSPLLNGSPLPSDIFESRLPCSASIGHTVKPFQSRRETVQYPYTSVHRNAGARHAHLARP